MRPDTVPAPVPAPAGGPRPEAPPAEASCWYRDAAHRPPFGWCPPACHGPLVFAERVGVRPEDRRTYCDVHGSWRRRAIHLPSLVRRTAAGE